jgi:hypothetical protein
MRSYATLAAFPGVAWQEIMTHIIRKNQWRVSISTTTILQTAPGINRKGQRNEDKYQRKLEERQREWKGEWQRAQATDEEHSKRGFLEAEGASC